jgi:uncharacterized Zn finger protein
VARWRGGEAGVPCNVRPWVFNVRMAVFAAFTEADIKRAAGARSFERGLEYLNEVADLEFAGKEITATVCGSREYGVWLTFGDNGLGGHCTCPQGRDGFFCKHCVAVGVCVLKMGEGLPRHIETARAQRQTLDSWLESLSKEELLAELSGLLDEDRDLRRRFELRAASVNLDAATVRRAVAELIALPRRGYIEYDEASRYASDVLKAVVAIDDLIQAGGAAAAIGIAREAIGLVAQAYRSIDDSSGSVADAEHELLAVHLRACEAAPPEPVSLGGYLAGLLLHDDVGFELALGDYADLLGDEGIATVRERIRTTYDEHPADWRARRLMESVARAEGDVDALIAIIAADLDDRGQGHLRIARELDEAGRGDEALGWAECGLREAARPDRQLVEYLAGRYAAAGRADDVLSLRLGRFQAERTLANYQALRGAATDSGTWPAERGQALALLNEDARHQRARVPWAWGGPVLMDALLDDGDLDAAWAAAKDAASEDQRLRLADASAAARPADALALYLRAVGSLKKDTGDPVYRRMASVLLSARACHQALGTTEQFSRYLAALRTEQKRKRNLMKILDENGL